MRKDPVNCDSEYRNFIKQTGLQESQLDAINLFEQPDIDPAFIEAYDGILLGGMSDDPSDSLAITHNIFPFIETLDEVLKHAIKIKKPCLLSCGGFMLGTVLLGGKLTLDPNKRELDILDIELTKASESDELMNVLPLQFAIVSGHIKSTSKLPPNCTLLAYSKRCPIHVFKLDHAPIYAFQGHPEITGADLIKRVEPYKEKYCNNEEEYLSFINSDKSTKQANGILKRFVEMALRYRAMEE